MRGPVDEAPVFRYFLNFHDRLPPEVALMTPRQAAAMLGGKDGAGKRGYSSLSEAAAAKQMQRDALRRARGE